MDTVPLWFLQGICRPWGDPWTTGIIFDKGDIT